MAFRISVTVDTSRAEALLTKMERRQIPYAKARAATAVARIAVQDLKAEMQSVFRDPRPFTLNAFYAKPAKRGDPSAYVASRDFATKGHPAINYLSPNIRGGPRGKKGFELLLGNVAGDQFAVPSIIDRLTRGQLTQLLSRVDALRDATQNLSQKTTARLRKRRKTVAASGHRSEYFVAHQGGKANGRPIGIYKLIGPGNVQKVMGFVPNAPRYVRRFKPDDIVQRSVGRYMPNEFRKALAEALATAK